jgi:cyclase
VLASRIIPVILAKGQQAVKGKGFDSWRSVGQLRQAIRIYEMRRVDEVILLDIAATPEGKEPNVAFVNDFAGEFFCPVTVGGGVSTLDHFRQLLAAGADKVALNTAAHQNPSLVTEAAKRFGSQAVVVSIDVKANEVVTHCGQLPTGEDPVAFASRMESMGAGEILLNAVERDGCLVGYDLDLVRRVSQAVSIPVIACGGAGNYQHFKEALDAGAHAVAASAIFAFTDATPKGAAQYLAQHGHRTRLAA